MARTPRLLTLVIGMASLLDSSAIIGVGLGLALWRDEYAMSVWTVGALSATLTACIAAGALVGGRMADLLGRTRIFRSSLVFYAAGAAAIAVGPSVPWLFVGVVVMGLASGADLPASLAVLTERAPAAARGRLVATTHVLWTVGVLLTTAAGLVLSTQGAAGVRGIFAGLGVLALATAAVRRHPAVRATNGAEVDDLPGTLSAGSLRQLVSDPLFIRPLLLTGGFYGLYTMVASTFGNFKTYFLITVGGATQTAATAITFATGLVGLAGTIVFATLADTPWRHRLFPIGMAIYAAALAIIAVTGGRALPAVVVALVLYNVAFPFVGDAIYKVWTQESFSAEVRATAQGATIAGARVLAALVAVVTPALLRWSPTLLFSLLLAIAAAAAAVGMRIVRARGRG